MRRLAVLLAAPALTLGFTLTAADVANAEVSEPGAARRGDTVVNTTEYGNAGGEVVFRPYGDWFWVCDTESDGRHAWGKLWVKRGGEWHVRWKNEDGPDTYCDGTKRKFNIKEHRRVKMKVCLQNNAHGKLRHCAKDKARA